MPTFQERVEVLHGYLFDLGHEYALNQFSKGYNDRTIVVNYRPHKYGASPAQIKATAKKLREDLIRLFGTQAEKWNSDFFRVQEMEYEDKLKTAETIKKRLEKAVKALPQIPITFNVIYSAPEDKKIPLRRIMLDNHEFIIEEPSRVKGRPPKKKRAHCKHVFTPEQKELFHRQLDEVEFLERSYAAAAQEVLQVHAYVNMNKTIKDSFDWHRLGNRHDNETAHAYQAIANPLWLLGTSSKWNDGKYQQQLRNAFDGKAVEDHRRSDTAEDFEYLVLTQEEAEELAVAQVTDSLWAFRAEWLKKWVPVSVCVLQKMQEDMCEDANEPIKALLGNKLGEFVRAAIAADGRGHFLSSYDGKEVKCGEFFLYCQNNNVEDGND